MADCGGPSRVSNGGVFPPADDPDPLKTLYPMVNEEETPLPQAWSNKDKYNYIGLSQNNLRVHYKGESQPCPSWCSSLFIFNFLVIATFLDFLYISIYFW